MSRTPPASTDTNQCRLTKASVRPDVARYVFLISTRGLIEKEVAAMPEPLQREVYDFARFLRQKNEHEAFNGLLLSESIWGSSASGGESRAPLCLSRR